jgi:hypothetical protein
MADPIADLVANIVTQLDPTTLSAIREFLIANEKEVYPIFRDMLIYQQELEHAAAIISPFTLITNVLGMILLRLLYIMVFSFLLLIFGIGLYLWETIE